MLELKNYFAVKQPNWINDLIFESPNWINDLIFESPFSYKNGNLWGTIRFVTATVAVAVPSFSQLESYLKFQVAETKSQVAEAATKLSMIIFYQTWRVEYSKWFFDKCCSLPIVRLSDENLQTTKRVRLNLKWQESRIKERY
jgi:hypothetical protein